MDLQAAHAGPADADRAVLAPEAGGWLTSDWPTP